MTDKKTLKVTLVKSPIGCGKDDWACRKGRRLKKRHPGRELEDTPAVRGMIAKVAFLVRVD